MQYAHRIAWLLAGRELKPGLVIDHVCRNTKCVNVDHLRLVPSRTNTLENNLSPIAANARREVCIKGHRFAPETTAIYTAKKKFTRHGNPMKPGPVRVCLICRPHYWRWAIIPRDPPPNARLRGTGRGAE
ncbi:MAG TPA: HNH endonuclease signature motif containing protein [Usitatibacter sp.]|nr:HNH endonuclease signature motif containing protein [Usitatibacter sp.]